MKIPNPIIASLTLVLLAGSLNAQEAGILTFGDSLTKGFGDFAITCEGAESGGYSPRLLQRLIQDGWQTAIDNSGVCGERTDEGISRLPTVLNGDKHDIVILMEATNDISQGVGVETMVFNLRFMGQVARGRGVQPIYSSVIPIRDAISGEIVPLFMQSIRNLANQEGAVFADPFTALAAQPNLFTEFYHDPFHPNPQGYDLLADAFVQPTETALTREGFRNLGHPHYCRDFGPCSHGQGDCDGNDECVAGATCVNDAGAEFGYKANIDVCIGDNVSNCTLSLGAPSFCTVCGPCNDGQGDCDNDSECLFGTSCTNNVGADFGLAPGTDICLRETPAVIPPTPCLLPNGHPNYCTECGPCDDGQGDCDGDAECAEGTFCGNNVGADFGFAPGIDICLSVEPGSCPLPLGHPHYCRECGPCAAGEGDCDGLDQCVAGTFCGQNNGADFGFNANIDVCVTQ